MPLGTYTVMIDVDNPHVRALLATRALDINHLYVLQMTLHPDSALRQRVRVTWKWKLPPEAQGRFFRQRLWPFR